MTAEKVEQQMGDGIKERPILFSAPMVRAILDGRKTQTRRIIKNVETLPNGLITPKAGYVPRSPENHIAYCPYGQPGDRLWVRETWSRAKLFNSHELFYRADGEYQSGRQLALSYHEREDRWRPSIHMPRWASRIDLEITGVRVERLQAISEADAKAEGVSTQDMPTATYQGWADGFHRTLFRDLWESINGPGSWDLNPWVWVVEFRRI